MKTKGVFSTSRDCGDSDCAAAGRLPSTSRYAFVRIVLPAPRGGSLGHPRIARLRVGPGENNGSEIGGGSGKLAQAADLIARAVAILARDESRRGQLQRKGHNRCKAGHRPERRPRLDCRSPHPPNAYDIVPPARQAPKKVSRRSSGTRAGLQTFACNGDTNRSGRLRLGRAGASPAETRPFADGTSRPGSDSPSGDR